MSNNVDKLYFTFLLVSAIIVIDICLYKIKEEDFMKKMLKKWWFWLLIIIFVMFIILGASSPSENSEVTETSTTNKDSSNTEIIKLEGEVLGDYGKKIVLNKDTDMPTEKYLYKIPSGKYKITTSSQNIVAFSVVKDEIHKEDNEKYSESLEYVGGQHLVTSSNDTLNGNASKDVEIIIHDDESILIVEKGILNAEKQAN